MSVQWSVLFQLWNRQSMTSVFVIVVVVCVCVCVLFNSWTCTIVYKISANLPFASYKHWNSQPDSYCAWKWLKQQLVLLKSWTLFQWDLSNLTNTTQEPFQTAYSYSCTLLMLTFFSDLDLSSICAVTGRSEWSDWVYFYRRLIPSEGEFFGWWGLSVYTRFSDLSCIWDQIYLCFFGCCKPIFLATWYVFSICARWSHNYFLSEKEFSDFEIDFQRLWEWESSICI